MQKEKLKIRLFGTFSVAWADGEEVRITSAKLKGLIALLASDSQGTRTRTWLQDKLWGRSGPEHGRASLRQALKNLRAIFKEDCDRLFDISTEQIQLRPSCFDFANGPGQGEFLEGLDITEPEFDDWLREQRSTPHQNLPLLPPAEARGKVLPSIAVLPFTRSYGNAVEEGIGDVLAQELIRALARSSLLEVISHLSCRRLDPNRIDLAQLKHLLNADYIVLGQFSLLHPKLRLDIDLIETGSGSVLWTGDFQGNLAEFLQADKEMIWEIGRQVGRKILSHSIKLATTQPLPDVQSHHLLMSSISLMHSLHLREFAKARTQLEELISRFDNVGMLHAWLAQWHNFLIQQGWSVDVDRDNQTALDYAKRAVDINPVCSLSLTMHGLLQTFVCKDFSEAASNYREALDIDPNNSLAWLYQGSLLSFNDQGSEAVKAATKARRLSPLDPHRFLYDALSATAASAAGDHTSALEFADRSWEANHRHSSTLRSMIAARVELGRLEEARHLAAKLMHMQPNFRIKTYLSNHPSGSTPRGRHWADILEKAGIPYN